MSMSIWEPVETSLPPRDLMNLSPDGSYYSGGLPVTFQFVPVNIRETARHYVVEAALPGVTPADLEVTAAGNTITIHAVARPDAQWDEMGIEEGADDEEGGGVYLRRERYLGPLSRTVELPGDVDAGKVEATYEHGLLTLWIPKTPRAAPRRIAVYPKER